MPSKTKTALEKLQELVDIESKLVKHEVEIKGIEWTFYARPTSISKFNAAKRASKDPDNLLETSARLFIKSALDESGKPLFTIDALPLIVDGLSLASASKLMGALNGSDEEEEAYSGLDMKSS